MNKENFDDRVKKYFGYLETEYEFNVIFERRSQNRPITDGVIKYASDKIVIIVDSETNQVAIKFVRLGDDENYYLDPLSIHEYQVTSIQEKKVLLSTDASKQNDASTIFRDKSLLTMHGWQRKNENPAGEQENLIKLYANWVKQNANLILSGDFSNWPELYEYKINRLIADELRKGKKAMVKAVIRDESGKLTTIDRHIFQREKDYLAKLKLDLLK